MRELAAFATRAALAEAASTRIARALNVGIAARGGACAALSGGATPGPAYSLLARRDDIDWPRVTFAMVDERFVPPDHPASNEKMLRGALAPALGAGARLLPLYGEFSDLDAAANAAEARYAGLQIDIAVMGMGADGHTASWFPRAGNLAAVLDLANTRTIVATRADEAAGASERLTMTRAAIARAAQVLLLISGDDKRAVLEAARTRGDAPIASLFAAGMAPVATMWAP